MRLRTASALIALALSSPVAFAEPPPPPGAQVPGAQQDPGAQRGETESPETVMPPAFTLPDKPKAETKAKAPSKPLTAQDRKVILTDLYKQLGETKDEGTATVIAETIEKLWNSSGSATADLLLQRAAAFMSQGRAEPALRLLSTVVELQPDYAEAWNRRAFVYYHLNDTGRALGDIRRVLALDPNHYKALEGLALLMAETGEKKSALKAFDKLLSVYPTMPGVKARRDELAKELEGQGI